MDDCEDPAVRKALLLSHANGKVLPWFSFDERSDFSSSLEIYSDFE